MANVAGLLNVWQRGVRVCVRCAGVAQEWVTNFADVRMYVHCCIGGGVGVRMLLIVRAITLFGRFSREHTPKEHCDNARLAHRVTAADGMCRCSATTVVGVVVLLLCDTNIV